MNDFLSFRTNPHSVILNDPHSVILNEVKNLYHKDPSLPLRMTLNCHSERIPVILNEPRYSERKMSSERPPVILNGKLSF